MKPKSKPGKKIRLSPEKQALRRSGSPISWPLRAAALAAQLRPSPTEEREGFSPAFLPGRGSALPLSRPKGKR
jgi:hypothetical protein